MMSRFLHYADKIFSLKSQVCALTDSRPKPQISTAAVWTSGFVMFATRRGSLNAIETQSRLPKRLRRLLGSQPPSADTIGRVFGLMEPEQLRSMLCRANHKLRRNKALCNDWPLRFAAVDGHEFFSSRCRSCPQCSERTIKVGGKKVTEYYHRGVVCHLVGFDIAVPIDIEMVRPHEGEAVAAGRLMERVLSHYGRFFDGVLADALYLQAPFINHVIEHHKHIMVVIRDEQRELFRDAEGLFSAMEPAVWTGPGKTIRAWDAEQFTSYEAVHTPLRVLHTEETTTTRHRVNRQWVETDEHRQWWWATTIPVSQLSGHQLCQVGHRRWDIENDLFNVLASHWSLDHCFKHDLTAIEAFTLTLFIAFVLVQCFYHRHLKPPLRACFTLIGITDELFVGLAVLTAPVAWVKEAAPP